MPRWEGGAGGEGRGRETRGWGAGEEHFANIPGGGCREWGEGARCGEGRSLPETGRVRLEENLSPPEQQQSPPQCFLSQRRCYGRIRRLDDQTEGDGKRLQGQEDRLRDSY